MKIDITRDSFDPAKNDFSRVLVLQGRALLDADFNEQTSILLNYMRTLVTDLVGPYWAPELGGGFLIAGTDSSFTIARGRYYVDGILVTNDTEYAYKLQPLTPPTDPATFPKGTGLVYLDVWERPITVSDNSQLSDPALQGADSSARAQAVWQVRVQFAKVLAPDGKTVVFDPGTLSPADFDPAAGNPPPKWLSFVNSIQSLRDIDASVGKHRGKLSGQADLPALTGQPGVAPPDTGYRGAENQLYRVEIHQGGPAGLATVKKKKQGKASGPADSTAATFKWSRDNGSVVYVVDTDSLKGLDASATGGAWLQLVDFGRDNRSAPSAGDWLELFYAAAPDGAGGPLFQVLEADAPTYRIRVKLPDNAPPILAAGTLLFRRWDQTQQSKAPLTDNGVVRIVESTAEEAIWIPLEDGISIRFDTGASYRPGDYWLIPARTAAGSDGGTLLGGDFNSRPPDGIEHHYAPLALIGGANPTSLRRVLSSKTLTVPNP